MKTLRLLPSTLMSQNLPSLQYIFQSAFVRNTLLTLITKNLFFLSLYVYLPLLIIPIFFMFCVCIFIYFLHGLPVSSIDYKHFKDWISLMLHSSFCCQFIYSFIPKTFIEHLQWLDTMGLKHCTRHWTFPPKVTSSTSTQQSIE